MKIVPPLGDPECVIRDNSTVSVRFNVLPGRFVEETFSVREYRIWHRYIEAEFDRTYWSEMEESPSHVILLTALAHCQKILYVYLCHELSIPYSPQGAEKLKFWPTKVQMRMPQMVTSETRVVHRAWVQEFRSYPGGRYKLILRSSIDGVIFIDGEVPAFLISSDT